MASGGYKNSAEGDYSFVAGYKAVDAGNDYSFVWGGFDEGTSAGVDTFNVWSLGGIYLNGSVHASSDRNMKKGFDEINPQEVLNKVVNMEITTWRFKSEKDSITHIGPVAQDFMEAFGYGVDDTHITSTDADGVALAVIQGLNLKLEEKQTEIDQLNDRLKAFETRLLAMEASAN